MHVTREMIISRTRGDRKSLKGGVCFSFFVFIENSRPSFYWKFLFYEEGRKEKKKKKKGGGG